MSSAIDVEALLDSTANAVAEAKEAAHDRRSADRDDRHKNERSERRERDRARDSSRDRDRDRKRRDRSRDKRRDKELDGDEDARSLSSPKGSVKSSRRRSRSRESDRRHSRRDRYSREPVDPDDAFRASGGDYYRGSGRPRSRSRSPDDDRYYRPNGRERRERSRDSRKEEKEKEKKREDRPRGGRGRDGRRRTPSPRRARSKSGSPQPTEDERDRRTVFVQQLAARLRTKELISFFEKVGPVKEAQIVKDRVSGRSKGVGYVEFKNEESVPLAIQLTGQKLLGIPIIAQLTEAEKNRQARTTEGGTSSANSGVPFHRLYVGNIHFSITEKDLQNVFEPFGELEFVQLQKEEGGRSRGYGFVQ